MPPRDVIIQYYDVMLRQADVRLLNDYMWFNDTVIEFYFEYLDQTICKNAPTILLLRPGIAHLISHAADTSFFDSALPSTITDCGFLFIPVNDNEENDAGGSHWSTLVYARALNTFFYYDSMNEYNLAVAQRTAAKFAEVLQLKEPEFQAMKTPQQDNGTDCGVYVVTITELLCTRLVAALKRDLGEEETEMLFEIVHDDDEAERPAGPAYVGSVPGPSHHRRKMRTLLEELLNLAGGVGGVID